MLINRIIIGSRATVPCLNKLYSQPLALQSIKTVNFISNNYVNQDRQKRLFHTTHIRRDMESAFRAIGAGFAITGVIGPGIGVGTIFGNLVLAVSRNPSMADRLFNMAIMGAAFSEALGLLAALIAFMAFLV